MTRARPSSSTFAGQIPDPQSGKGFGPLIQVRCPHCNKLAAEAAPGSKLRVRCVRCRQDFKWQR